jgi:hypothetical protein
MLMHKHAILGLLILLNLVGYTSPVSACSGGPPPWNEWLPKLVEASDVVVLGQYTTLDDAEANGIFRVQTYLIGSGSEYLVISASDLRAIENRFVGRFYDRCGIFKPDHLQTTGTYIYFLKRQNTGMYVIQHGRYFPSADVVTSIWDSSNKAIELDSKGLSAQISSQMGSSSQKPDEDASYPRTTPILLTTESNQNFLLPVDSLNLVLISKDEIVDLRRDQHECSSPPCTVYSPNGVDKVYLQSEGSEPQEIEWYLPYVESNAVGERIVFSATSETYALWKDNQIQLYALWYPKLGYPDNWIDSHTTALFNTTPADNSLQFPAVWSPDGRTLAFSTDEGLWLWDALATGYPPQLLIPVQSTVPVARYFSPRGRYLAVDAGDRRYNLDLVTRRELPDGYVSPNDRILLVFDTAAEKPTSLEVAYLAPGIRQFEYYPKVEYLDVQWIDDAYFRASITGFSYLKYKDTEPYQDESGAMVREAITYVIEERFYDTVQYHSSGILSIEFSIQVPYPLDDVQMGDFTYKNGPGLIEISLDGYSLSINGNLVSLASGLASPIKEAVWLPSAFYFADIPGKASR